MPRLDFFKPIFVSGGRVSKFGCLFVAGSISVSVTFSIPFSFASGGDRTPDDKLPNSCVSLVSQPTPGERQDILPAPILRRLEGLVLNLDRQVKTLRRYTHFGSENQENQEDLVDEIMEDSSQADDLVGAADRAAIEIMNALREHPNAVDSVRWLNEVTDYFILKYTLWHVTGKRNERLAGLSEEKIGQKKKSYPEVYISLVEILISQIEKRGFTRELSRNQLVSDLALFAMRRAKKKIELDSGVRVDRFLDKRINAAQERAFALVTELAPSQIGRPDLLNFEELLLFGSKWIVTFHREMEAIQGENGSPPNLDVGVQDERYGLVANALLNYYFNQGHDLDQVLAEFIRFHESGESDLELAMTIYWNFAVHFGIVSSEDIALSLVLNERGLIPELSRYKEK